MHPLECRLLGNEGGRVVSISCDAMVILAHLQVHLKTVLRTYLRTFRECTPNEEPSHMIHSAPSLGSLCISILGVPHHLLASIYTFQTICYLLESDGKGLALESCNVEVSN